MYIICQLLAAMFLFIKLNTYLFATSGLKQGTSRHYLPTLKCYCHSVLQQETNNVNCMKKKAHRKLHASKTC